MLLSILIPTYNEEKYIKECLESVLSQDYPTGNLEILVIDGSSTDNTRQIVRGFIMEYPFIRLLENPDRFVPHAMNIGIKESNGKYIIRLDAHAAYPPNYFSSLVELAQMHNTDNIGGVCITDVKNETLKSWAIQTALSHKFGVGNSTFRIGATEPQIVDTVPFGCFKRDVFDRFGYYDERLVRNQDIELNKRISSGGGKVLLVPAITCTYFARETFTELSKNNYKNGYWNILTVYYTKNLNSLSFRHFVPLIFVFSLVLPVFLAFFSYNFIWVGIFSIILYLSSLLFILISITGFKLKRIIYLFPAFLLLHLSYGIGSVAGIWKVLQLKYF